MKIDQIIDMWTEDCQIDLADLSNETVKSAKLQSKYLSLLSAEKIKLRVMTKNFKELRHEKREFLINPTDEGIEKGWNIPPKGRLLKNEVEEYISGDKEILDAELKVGIQTEKVELLKAIVDSLNRRTYAIKNILDDRRFMHGG